MPVELFPRELTRKQYGLRLLAVFAFVAVGLWLFVAALISGYVANRSASAIGIDSAMMCRLLTR